MHGAGVRMGAMHMQRKRWWIGILLGVAMLLRSPAGADESDPLPAPKGTPRERAVRAYNEGVTLMRDKHYAAAQEQFEQALALDETLAEAHNNLAFSLRMQGTHHFARALHHYQRALELKSDLAQAYLYRGVLFTSMGDYASARADHAKLLALDQELAAKLERIIAGADGRDEYDGLTGASEGGEN
jgi:tetratricopeptide (TPR) repeat protein